MKHKKMKIIFVNNPAATNGGALTILKQFLENVAKKFSNEFKFYVFCTVDLEEFKSEKNIIIINNINAKKIKDRIIWDLWGLKKWSKKNNIEPDLIVSLQNTGIGSFRGINQIVYLHQSIPYYKNIKWNPLKKNERKYWFYRYMYKFIIHCTIKNKFIIVQSKWMKEAVIKDHKIKRNNIFVIKPKVKVIENSFKEYKEEIEKERVSLFYPASADIYKNHEVLIDTLLRLKSSLNEKTIILYLTINKTDFIKMGIWEKVKKYNLEKNIVFLGQLSFNRVLDLYKETDIVLFPSYIETIGLPLLEAAQMGKAIVVSDLEYSRETLMNYKGVIYVQYNDPRKWEEAILIHVNRNQINYNYKAERDEWDKFIEIIINKCRK